MKLLKKTLALMLTLSLLFSFIACGDKNNNTSNDDQGVTGDNSTNNEDNTNNEGENNTGDSNGDNTDNKTDDDEKVELPPVMVEYTVTVLSPLGAPVSDVTVLVHEDGESDYNVCTAPLTTDASGRVTVTLDSNKSYSVGVLGYPKVFSAKSGNTPATRYILDSENVTVVLDSNNSFSPTRYKLGDTVGNFTLSDINGNKYELYEILKEKELVVLNFWFCNCYYCVKEFPALNEAYNANKDSVEVLAINDVGDSLSSIKTFVSNNGLDMPVFKETSSSKVSLTRYSSEGAYPTTVLIDRYGTVTMIHLGALTNASDWNKLFTFFTAEDYTTTVLNSYKDIL